MNTDLVKFYGANIDLRTVGVEQAEAFKRHYQERGLASATTYRRLKMAKMLFGHALKLRLIDANPFANVKSKNHNSPERRYYITADDTRKLIDAANPVWRTITALARFGGLRCPSEVLSLRWESVNLATGRMVVHSPKTEHLDGRAERVVPIFAALRPYLEVAWELAAPREVYVVGGKQGDAYRATANGPKGWVNTNLRTTFEKLIRRAGFGAVAEAVSELAGELRDRFDGEPPDSRRHGVDRKHAEDRPRALPASARRGLREGGKGWCRIRCSCGAKRGAVTSRRERIGADGIAGSA